MLSSCLVRDALLAIVTSTLWLVSSAALAQEADGEQTTDEVTSDEEAVLHFRSGEAYFHSGEYDAALREFRRSYDLSERAELFFNMSLCHERMDQFTEAEALLHRYLDEVEEILNRPQLERKLERLRERSSQEGQQADQQEQERLAEEQRQRDEQARQQELLRQEQLRQEREAEAQRNTLFTPAVISWGVGGAGLILGGVALGLYFGKKGEIEDLPCSATSTCTRAQVEGLDNRALLVDIGFGLAIAGAATGVLLWMLGRPQPQELEGPPRPQLSVAPWMNQTDGGLVLEGSF